nr:MAG TPA: hypothetical protein [Caudoviricetes sp.]
MLIIHLLQLVTLINEGIRLYLQRGISKTVRGRIPFSTPPG